MPETEMFSEETISYFLILIWANINICDQLVTYIKVNSLLNIQYIIFVSIYCLRNSTHPNKQDSEFVPYSQADLMFSIR